MKENLSYVHAMVSRKLRMAQTADLSYVISAGRSIAKVLKPGDLVILESTVPPRCTLDVFLPVFYLAP